MKTIYMSLLFSANFYSGPSSFAQVKPKLQYSVGAGGSYMETSVYGSQFL